MKENTKRKCKEEDEHRADIKNGSLKTPHHDILHDEQIWNNKKQKTKKKTHTRPKYNLGAQPI